MKLGFPRPATVIASTALFVALSGGAWAAGIVPLAKHAYTADTATNSKKLGGKSLPAVTVTFGSYKFLVMFDPKSHLPAAVRSPQPLPMEALDQKEGFILYRTRLVGHAVMRPRDLELRGRETAVDERVLLVLHDDEPAAPNVLEQPRVGLDECRLGLVGAAANDDRVEARQVALGELARRQHMDRQTDGRERLGHPVGGAADVAHGA